MSRYTVFVSGHLDLTEQEFAEQYVPALEHALKNDALFVVGDARGADTLAQDWLAAHDADVVVFHMLMAPRNNTASFPTRGGFTSDQDRDEAMTSASHADIAWVRPGREKSGTAANLARRAVILRARL